MNARDPALNYHHLHYFWVVAHEGSISRASTRLSTSKATISTQLRQLEKQLGAALFEREGRKLALTDTGRGESRGAFYADDIFAMGRELVESIGGRGSTHPLQLRVGVGDVLPKPIVRRLLEPVFALPERIYVVCREDRPIEGFCGELAAGALDVVLSDVPVGAGVKTSVHGHLLGECATAMFAAPQLAASLRGEFPKNLHGAPWLLPGAGTDVRRGLSRSGARLRDRARSRWPSRSSLDSSKRTTTIVHRDLKPENIFLAEHADGTRRRLVIASLGG